ncbi:hypothetical protein IR196_13710 [Brucella anthropi]|uniref:hypothetical protein n=1 Tax=Brucella anthropi TaxID=529 RepID=UPI00188B48F7|nr:hypothetical protein [Brucella anthropi]QPA29259.1 hypothetical protein IR196_13710 [Brucella anthropi]
MSGYKTSTQQLWSKAIADVNAGTGNQVTSGRLAGNAENALPATSLEKLERFRSERRAAYAAYIDASDSEQEARFEFQRREGFAHRAQEQFQGLTLSFEGQSHSSHESKEEGIARINAPVERARRALQIASDARERADKRHDEFAFLSAVEGWLNRTPFNDNADLVAVDPSRLKGNPLTAISRIRSELASLDKRLSSVELAYTPADVLKDRAFAEIDRAASKGELSVHPSSRSSEPLRLEDKLTISTYPSGSLLGNGGANVLVWLLRDQMKAAVSALIDTFPQENALSDDDREAEFRTIAAERLDLERLEEGFITQAEANGQTIPRRHDVDPRAFLEIEA